MDIGNDFTEVCSYESSKPVTVQIIIWACAVLVLSVIIHYVFILLIT